MEVGQDQVGMDQFEHLHGGPGPNFELSFKLEAEFLANGTIPVRKYRSEKTSLTTYFVDLDTQVINGYFCFGTDEADAVGIEGLIWHLDSSGGLLPRPMRGDLLRPAWQFHGAENPLADRDQSCYVCCALGESAFCGTFACGVYLLQNIEAVFDAHGYRSPFAKKDLDGFDETTGEPSSGAVDETDGESSTKGIKTPVDETGDVGDEREPLVSAHECYCLSESGEGAMAWEVSLQAMFPGTRAFWNRLLTMDSKTRLSTRMRSCHDRYYRPENLSVIITGKLTDPNNIFEILQDYEKEYLSTHSHIPPFVRPWAQPLPTAKSGSMTDVRFVPRNPTRDPSTTICFGWRGCASKDFEKTMALKVLTAHLAVGPLWNHVTKGTTHRISWCQLEYADGCSLVTMHGVGSDEEAEKVVKETKELLKGLGDPIASSLQLDQVRKMAVRVGWHFIRELESEPALVLASTLSKCERYAEGETEFTTKRLFPQDVFDELGRKPMEYWTNLISTYFSEPNTFVTRVMPKTYKKPERVELSDSKMESEVSSGEQTFVGSSKRASSRPRRMSNAVGEEANNANQVEDLVTGMSEVKVAEGEGGCPNCGGTETPEECEFTVSEGLIKKVLEAEVFPLGHHPEEADDMNSRLGMTRLFLDDVRIQESRYYEIKTYKSDGEEQHPAFPVNQMPFYTYLEDIKCSFVYMTLMIDTTGIGEEARKVLGALTAAIGAILCPRPPALDTDSEIVNPSEFNPPLLLTDSQVSLGLNGEMMQCIFITIVVRPENYSWAIGMFDHLLNKTEFDSSFLRFVSGEGAKGLAANYRMQTAQIPNYNCFDATEINLHSLVNLMYKKESNARLFVGRRRLDLINEFIGILDKEPQVGAKLINDTWKTLVGGSKIILQVGANVAELAKTCGKDLSQPWRERFAGLQRPLVFSECRPTVERDLVRIDTPGTGIAVAVEHVRPSCLSLAVTINPNHEDFPALCIASQLFSMAQKWAWYCMEEEDVAQPVLRMPSSYSNILTLNVESPDVLGTFYAMKHIIREDWEWITPMLTATKLMVVNDPASMEMGPAGAITSAMLAHLNDQTLDERRGLLIQSLNVTVEDIQRVVRNHLVHLFDPEKCWCALMAHGSEKDDLKGLFAQLGFKLMDMDLTELCTTI